MDANKINLHPGFRFNPFQNELINLYLKPKVIGEALSCNVVEERQLYGPNANPWEVFDRENHPWILSEVSCGKFEKIAYAFVNLTKKAANSNNKSHVGREQYMRIAGCGTWDGQTKRTEIRDCDGKLIGERRMLVFEINEVSDQVDLSRVGHWRMHEYHLCGVNKDIPNLSNTVLCKITLDHSKKPPIKLLQNRTTRAPEKNKTKKTKTQKLDVVVCSSSSTNSAVVDTFEGISKSCGTDYNQTCDDDDLEWINSIYDGCSLLEKVENGPMTDYEDWNNNTFVSKEGEDGNLYINMSEFEFPSYPEHEDAQPLVDVTNNMGKRKLQPETSYADVRFQFINSFKVLKKPVHLRYMHARAHNYTSLGGLLELDPANSVSGKYDFGSGDSKLKYSYSHQGLTTVELGYNFGRQAGKFGVSQKFNGNDVVKASYKSDKKILGVDFVKNTGDGSFKGSTIIMVLII